MSPLAASPPPACPQTRWSCVGGMDITNKTYESILVASRPPPRRAHSEEIPPPLPLKNPTRGSSRPKPTHSPTGESGGGGVTRGGLSLHPGIMFIVPIMCVSPEHAELPRQVSEPCFQGLGEAPAPRSPPSADGTRSPPESRRAAYWETRSETESSSARRGPELNPSPGQPPPGSTAPDIPPVKFG